MKKFNWSRCAYAAAMSFLLSTAAMACLLTAFDIECSIGTVLFWCMAVSILWSIAMSLKRGWISLAVFALILGYVYRSGLLGESVAKLLADLTATAEDSRGTADCVLCIVAAVGCLNTASALCKKGPAVFCVLFNAVPLVPCMLSATAMPNPFWLGVWIFGVTLILLTQMSRKRLEGSKLTAVMVVPAAILTLALLLCLPQSAQEKPKAFARQAVQLLQELGIGVPQGKGLQVDGGAVELRKLGPREEASYPVMRVTSDRGGALYLRGCAYDTYFQNNWTNLNLREEFYWPTELEAAGRVTVKTEYTMSMRYFPYYGADGSLDAVSRGINNFSKQKEYSYEVAVLTAIPDTYTSKPEHGYTQLPTVAQRWAESVLRELITADMTDAEKLAAITGYVKGLAKYSLHADKMPADASDFVVWFASEADRGYCVHFASAAAVLLRAAGIPARFVTGYMVQAEAGKETVVYGKDAHAWAECFLEGVGWIPVEATPGAEPEEAQPQPAAEVKPLNIAPVLYGGTALMGALTLFMPLRWAVNVLRRRRKRKTGDVRSRLLATYSQLEELLALDGKKPPEQLRLLAERAKFSNHPVEAASLDEMEQALKISKKVLRKHSVFKRIQYRFISTLY